MQKAYFITATIRYLALPLLLAQFLNHGTVALHAAEVLDQQNDFPTGIGDTASLFSQEIGQTFTVGVEGTLSRIEVLMAKITATDSAVLTVYNTTEGLPNAALGTTLVSSASIIGTSFVSFDFSFYNIAIDVGDVFAFGLSSSAGGLYVMPYDNFFTQYDAGVRVRRTLSMPPGAWSTPLDHDHGFKTYVNAVIPDDLLGDYNGNEFIDAADYTVWRDVMTAGSSILLNDPTPGTVDESDFIYWRDHFGVAEGSGAGSSSAAVPEPASMALALVGMACLALIGRQGTGRCRAISGPSCRRSARLPRVRG